MCVCHRNKIKKILGKTVNKLKSRADHGMCCYCVADMLGLMNYVSLMCLEVF